MYPIDRLSFRLLVVGWLLIAMVLVNSYSSTIISYLSVAKMRPSINTFEDIVKSQDVGIILRKDYVIGKQILASRRHFQLLSIFMQYSRKIVSRIFKILYRKLLRAFLRLLAIKPGKIPTGYLQIWKNLTLNWIQNASLIHLYVMKFKNTEFHQQAKRHA